MRRSDDIFFFTLIDFLLQVFFFGLLLFVVGQHLKSDEERNRATEIKEREHLLKAAGVSSITELTDRLTKMAPLDQLLGSSDFIARNGGEKAVQAAVAAVSAAGGVEKVAKLKNEVDAMTDRIAKLKGWGKVSCIPNITVKGVVRPKSIATVVVADEMVTLQNPTPELHQLLSSLGMRFESVEALSPAAFRRTFAGVVTKQPECRYFLDVVTKTRFLAPMRDVWSAFRTQ
ncbi:MAG: hypothetical protein K0B16_13240 [Burkholderiaceae bacterium]|nr:hypothetical protein [Burkholderiaceae bacterium]